MEVQVSEVQENRGRDTRFQSCVEDRINAYKCLARLMFPVKLYPTLPEWMTFLSKTC